MIVWVEGMDHEFKPVRMSVSGGDLFLLAALFEKGSELLICCCLGLIGFHRVSEHKPEQEERGESGVSGD